jgi:exosortase
MAVRAGVAVAALLLGYGDVVLGYLRDQHYQEHFLYLWLFVALSLWRGLEGPFRDRFTCGSARDVSGLVLVGGAWLLLAIGTVAGSSSVGRASLVALATGFALLAVGGWSVAHCLLHGALMQLCFGVPYSVHAPLTSHLQWGVAAALAIPARLGLVDYTVDATTVVFPHYALTVTPDCSGLGQLLTFVGIAALAVLRSARQPVRTVGLFALAIALAWLSNLTRVGMFVVLVGCGWTQAIDDATWHAGLGFVAFLPFVVVLVAVALHTQRPRPRAVAAAWPRGGLPLAWLLVPVVLVPLAAGRAGQPATAPPVWFAALGAPPGHVLEQRAASEAAERIGYETPWLVNARFRAGDGRSFDLFHYTTRSTGHLCVHQVAACLQAPGQVARTAPPIEVDGRTWWRLALDTDEPDAARHVYFAFEVGGRRCDDSLATQWRVFTERLSGGSWDVQFTRVMLPGPLPDRPDEYAEAVLAWLGGLAAAGGAAPAPRPR